MLSCPIEHPKSEVLYVIMRAVRTRSVFDNSETEIDIESTDAKKVKMYIISNIDAMLRAEGVEPEEISVERDTRADDPEGAMQACEKVLTRVVVVISDS